MTARMVMRERLLTERLVPRRPSCWVCQTSGRCHCRRGPVSPTEMSTKYSHWVLGQTHPGPGLAVWRGHCGRQYPEGRRPSRHWPQPEQTVSPVLSLPLDTWYLPSLHLRYCSGLLAACGLQWLTGLLEVERDVEVVSTVEEEEMSASLKITRGWNIDIKSKHMTSWRGRDLRWMGGCSLHAVNHQSKWPRHQACTDWPGGGKVRASRRMFPVTGAAAAGQFVLPHVGVQGLVQPPPVLLIRQQAWQQD